MTRAATPPLTRDEGRPVRRRSRTFRPNYLSFAGTYQCNLNCAHCSVPIEWPDRLDITAAVRFLEDAHAFGIRTLAFTGGEPFLYLEFLITLTRRAAQLGFRFDKVMTNGLWPRHRRHLRAALTELADAGFTGKLGLSVDKFHGTADIDRLAEFCRTARRVFRRDTIVAVSYASRSPDHGLEPVRRLAEALQGVIEHSPVLNRYLLVTPDLTIALNWNHLAPVERAEKLQGGWAGDWFAEDYCEGPGQALIVTPKGDVKPCCGFASDLDQLTIGNIHADTVSTIVRRARRHPYVGKVFREGLLAIRDEILARDPSALPGSTANQCFFCWYVLTRGLAASAAGRRMSLPLAGSTVAPFVLAYDGRTVRIGADIPAGLSAETRLYSLSIHGPADVTPPTSMTWGEYQAWQNDLRDRGFELTTRDYTPCRG